MHYNSCNYRKNYFLFVQSSFNVFSIITASKLTQTLSLTFLNFTNLHLLNAFVFFDTFLGNGNGTLERMELYKASHMDKELGQYVAPRQCGDAFKRMDTMNNGKVTFESFLAFCMDVRA